MILKAWGGQSHYNDLGWCRMKSQVNAFLRKRLIAGLLVLASKARKRGDISRSIAIAALEYDHM